MVLAVRQIGPDDWRDWRAVRLQALRDDPEFFGTRLSDVDDRESAWRARIEAADACFLAVLDGSTCGMVAADPTPEGLRLQAMFVTGQAREHGVGQALIDSVVKHAGDRPLHLCVVEDNPQASSVYERAGFLHDGAEPDADGHLFMHYVSRSQQ